MKKNSSSKLSILSTRPVQLFTQSGFTLVELMFVMVLIVAALNVAVKGVQYSQATAQGNAAAAGALGVNASAASTTLSDAIANMTAAQKLEVVAVVLQRAMIAQAKLSGTASLYDDTVTPSRSGQIRSAAANDAGRTSHGAGSGAAASGARSTIHNEAVARGGGRP